jgi:hypothetical protein
MAREATSVDVLKSLKEALDSALRDVNASAEYHYSGTDRGSLSIIREGKALQTSYFASFEIQALRDGGAAALDKQKQALLDQVQRLLNPPKPQPISLSTVLPARRGRAGARAKAATEGEGETAAEPTEEAGDEE